MRLQKRKGEVFRYKLIVILRLLNIIFTIPAIISRTPP